MAVKCPDCGKEFPDDGAKYQGHRGYHKAHPESIPKGSPSETSTLTKTVESVSSTTTAATTATTANLEPVTFSYTKGEPVTSQEIPEFKPEEEKGKPPPTAKATLAEERGAGVSAIAALLLPLFDMWNRFAAGEPALPTGPEAMKLTKQDAENLAQAVILVDAKHGGAISKAFGSEEYGAELFLAGVSMGIGIKMFMAIRMRQPAKRAPATAGLEKKEEERKNPLQPIADLFKAKPKEEKKEEGVVEIEKPMTGDEFQDFAAKRMREMEAAG